MRRLIIAAALALAACGQNESGSVMDEIDRQEAAAAGESQAAEAEKAAFLAENAKRAGVTVTSTGLQYEIVRAAESESLPRPGAEDVVTVHYEGTLRDGTVFDSSYQRREPAQFPLNAVIPGWTEGVALMRPGEEFRFVIPADLAYGASGAPPSIGPNEPLVFKVELLSFRRASDGKVIGAE